MADFTINDLAATSGLSASHNIELQQTPGEGSVRASLPTVADYLQTLLENELSIFPGYVTGGTRHYANNQRFAAGVATITQTIDVIHYSSMYIRRRVTIDRVYIQTGSTNAVAGNANIGIYSSANGYPGDLLFTVVNGASIPATANSAVIVAPTSGSITLEPGFYWFAIQPSATFNMTGTATTAFASFDFGTANTSALFANTSQVAGYTQTVSYGSGLPATATPTISTSSLASGGFRVQ